jgi:hypothetical protein
MKPCRECGHEVSEQALICPNCGAPQPARDKWDGWGFEYKSEATLFGWPLLHISLKYRPNRKPVPAIGIIAIGQFGVGIINLSIRGGFIQCQSIHRFGLCLGPVRYRLFADRPIWSIYLSGPGSVCAEPF